MVATRLRGFRSVVNGGLSPERNYSSLDFEKQEVTERVLAATVNRLQHHGVLLEACLLKPQMVIQGTEFQGPKPMPEEIAAHTLTALRRSVGCFHILC